MNGRIVYKYYCTLVHSMPGVDAYTALVLSLATPQRVSSSVAHRCCSMDRTTGSTCTATAYVLLYTWCAYVSDAVLVVCFLRATKNMGFSHCRACAINSHINGHHARNVRT